MAAMAAMHRWGSRSVTQLAPGPRTCGSTTSLSTLNCDPKNEVAGEALQIHTKLERLSDTKGPDVSVDRSDFLALLASTAEVPRSTLHKRNPGLVCQEVSHDGHQCKALAHAERNEQICQNKGAPVAKLEMVSMPFATSSFLLLVARMLLVVRPGAPSSVRAPSSDALCY